MALDEREHRRKWLGGIRDGHSLPKLGDRLAAKYGATKADAPAEVAVAPAEVAAAVPMVCPHCGYEMAPKEEAVEEVVEPVADAAPVDEDVDPEELASLLESA